jgi:hypothetical protein
VLDSVAEMVALGVFPDPHQHDETGQPKPGVALVFDLTELVQNLDRLPVQKLDRSPKRNRSNPRTQPVYSAHGTGLVETTNQHQNGSRSTEGTIEGTNEGTICASTSEARSGSTFNLVAPGSQPETPKPKAKRPTGEASPEHQPTVDHYHQEFEAKHGCAPIFGAAEGKAIKSLLEKLKGNGAEARRRITIALTAHWKSDVTIRDIARNPDQFATESPSRTNGRKTPQQADAGSIDDVIAKKAAGVL